MEDHFSIAEVAAELHMTEAAVLRACLDGKLDLSIRFSGRNLPHGKLRRQLPMETGYPPKRVKTAPLGLYDMPFTLGSDRSLYTLVMAGAGRLCVEDEYQKASGRVPVASESSPSSRLGVFVSFPDDSMSEPGYVMLYELVEYRETAPANAIRDDEDFHSVHVLPAGSELVITKTAMAAFQAKHSADSGAQAVTEPAVSARTIFPPTLSKLSLWDIACLHTGQNAKDLIPTNETRHKLAELILAVRNQKLWIEFIEPGEDYGFITGLAGDGNRAAPDADWRKLDRVTVRREHWVRYEEYRAQQRERTLDLIDAQADYWERRQPAPLFDGPGFSGEALRQTTLTKYLEYDSWTPAAAAMLVYGLQAPINNGQLCTEIPAGGVKGLDGIWKSEQNCTAFADARRVLGSWRAQKNPPATVSPFDFIVWCKSKGIDTAWLSDIENDSQQQQEIADAWLRQQKAREQLPPTVIEEAFRKYGQLFKALLSPVDVQNGNVIQPTAISETLVADVQVTPVATTKATDLNEVHETPEQHRARALEVLKRNNGNKTAAGKELGVSRQRVHELVTPKTSKDKTRNAANMAHDPFAQTQYKKPKKHC